MSHDLLVQMAYSRGSLNATRRQSSSQRKSRRLSGKPALIKLRFPRRKRNPWPSLPRLRSAVIISWKLDKFTLFTSIYPFPRPLKLGKSLQTCCVNFFPLKLAFWARKIRILESIFFYKTKTDCVTRVCMTVSRCVAFLKLSRMGFIRDLQLYYLMLQAHNFTPFLVQLREGQTSFLLWRIHGKNSFSHFRRTLRGDGRFNDHLSGLCLFVFSKVNRHQNPVFAVTWRLVNQKPRVLVSGYSFCCCLDRRNLRPKNHSEGFF